VFKAPSATVNLATLYLIKHLYLRLPQRSAHQSLATTALLRLFYHHHTLRQSAFIQAIILLIFLPDCPTKYDNH
jgi:hypothetical protein